MQTNFINSARLTGIRILVLKLYLAFSMYQLQGMLVAKKKKTS